MLCKIRSGNFSRIVRYVVAYKLLFITGYTAPSSDEPTSTLKMQYTVYVVKVGMLLHRRSNIACIAQDQPLEQAS